MSCVVLRSLAVPLLGLVPVASPLHAQGSCSAQARVETVGLATAGVDGLLSLALKGAPVLGGPFALRLTGGPPLGHGCLVYSHNELPVFFPEFGATGFPGVPLFTEVFTFDAEGKLAGVARARRGRAGALWRVGGRPGRLARRRGPGRRLLHEGGARRGRSSWTTTRSFRGAGT